MYTISMWPPLLSRLRRPAAARLHSILLGGSSRAYTSVSAGDFNRDPVPVAAGAWPRLCNCCGANQLQQRRRNLYVVLDDWEKGFSLHKLSLEDLVGNGEVEPQRLPEPILRLSFRAIGSSPRFHAVGSNIVVTSNRDGSLRSSDNGGLTLIYDNETTAMEIENSLPCELDIRCDAMAADDKLYAFNKYGDDKGGVQSVHCLRWTEPEPEGENSDDSEQEEDFPHGLRLQPRWAWERIPAPPPFGGPMGYGDDMYSRALHPDGLTVFVSIGSTFIEKEQHGTFSLDTASGKWTRLGDWSLPFKGQAYYDGDLGAWVGARTVYSKEDCRGYEHLCTCDVPAPQGGATPAWMVAKEKLTFLEPSMKPLLGYTLLRTGGNGGGMFCLVEPAVRQGYTYRNFMGDGDKCLLRLTMFRAKYSRHGEIVAAPLRPGRSYLVSRYVGDFGPYVFWI